MTIDETRLRVAIWQAASDRWESTRMMRPFTVRGVLELWCKTEANISLRTIRHYYAHPPAYADLCPEARRVVVKSCSHHWTIATPSAAVVCSKCEARFVATAKDKRVAGCVTAYDGPRSIGGVSIPPHRSTTQPRGAHGRWIAREDAVCADHE